MATEEPDPSLPDDHEEAAPLPNWVPILIGVVLVVMAGLAVWTGMRYRAAPTDKGMPSSRQESSEARGGAPGEPQAGGSRVMPDEVPEAGTPDASRSRISITGGPGKIETTLRYFARRGAWFAIEPRDATIFVNEQQIGPANQFGSPEEAYEFPAEGKFSLRIVAPGYEDELLIINADPGAPEEVVRITRTLQESKH